MGALMVISLGLLLLAGFPLLAYYYAKEKGRKAKTWLMIGILLPGIAVLILSLLPDKTAPQDS